jgi:hypothetical protein
MDVSETHACKALAPLARGVYEPLAEAGGSMLELRDLSACIDRLVDHTARCATDPTFGKMVDEVGSRIGRHLGR